MGKSQVFHRAHTCISRNILKYVAGGHICPPPPPPPPPPVLIGLTKEDDDEFEYVSKNENFGQYWQYWHVRRKPIGDQQSTISAPTRSHIPEGVNILQWKIFHWGTIFPRQKYRIGDKYSTGRNISQGKIIS